MTPRLKTFAIAALLAARALLPDNAHAADKDIVAMAAASGSFHTLSKALDAAGLVPTLQGPGPFTVFAPTDDAFAKLPPGTLESLLKPENKAQLVAILTYHVVPGRLMASDVAKAHELTTVEGKPLEIKAADGAVMVDDAKVTATDIAASNGVIHVIDHVVLPPSQ